VPSLIFGDVHVTTIVHATIFERRWDNHGDEEEGCQEDREEEGCQEVTQNQPRDIRGRR
jgi:hypothetical protein